MAKRRRNRPRPRKQKPAAANPPSEAQFLEAAPAARPWPRWATLLACVLVLAVGIAAFWNSFDGLYMLDDHHALVDNPNVRAFQFRPEDPLTTRLAGLLDPDELIHYVSRPQSSRPLVNFSLAMNFVVGRYLGERHEWASIGPNGMPDKEGFHLFNLIVHLLAALLVFGLVRRTLTSPLMRERFARVATPLATAVTMLWVVHPLQTESVTYIIQRSEAMVGLFYLLTMYCSVRGATTRRWGFRAAWYVAAVVACLAGMASKEVMVTAPLAVLLYHRVFLFDSWKRMLRPAGGHVFLYVCLAATWLPLALLVRRIQPPEISKAGFGLEGVSPWDYARSQFGAILLYLKLSFIPYPQVLDYGWSVADEPIEWVPQAVAVLGLAGLSIYGLIRRKAIGYAGFWFFLALAPSSTILPIQDIVFEHRMYLSLAALAAIVVCGGWWLGRRLLLGLGREREAPTIGWTAGLVLAGAATTALGVRTHVRNRIYHAEVPMYREIAVQQPENARAVRNYGVALFRQAEAMEKGAPGLPPVKRDDVMEDVRAQKKQAMGLLKRSVELDPEDEEGHNTYAKGLAKTGRPELAEKHYIRALRLTGSTHMGALTGLAALYSDQGKLEEATKYLRHAIALKPDEYAAHIEMGIVLDRLGRPEEAIEYFKSGLALRPSLSQIRFHIGRMYARLNRPAEAARWFAEELRLTPGNLEARFNYAVCLSGMRRGRQALEELRAVLRQAPDSPRVLVAMAWLLATCPDPEVRDGPEATDLAGQACEKTQFNDPNALAALAVAHAETGRWESAINAIDRAIALANRMEKPEPAERWRGYRRKFLNREPIREWMKTN
jgi:tetratricopeptide (TPR) repeat protein